MKLRWSVKRGGIIVKTYTKSTCSHRDTSVLDFHTRPPIKSARQANAMETTMNSGKEELLDAEVTELLRKGANHVR